jgi:hypothetical protein
MVGECTNLSAILKTIIAAPGLWMHIIGMLRAPTTFIWYVCISCGAYWIAASKAEETPRKVAHEDIVGGSGADGLEEGGMGVLARRYSVVSNMKALFDLVSCESGRYRRIRTGEPQRSMTG